MILRLFYLSLVAGISLLLGTSCWGKKAPVTVTTAYGAKLTIAPEDPRQLDYYKKKIEETLPLNRVLWESVIGNEAIKTMALRGEFVYVETFTPRLYAIRTDTGTRQWQFSLAKPLDFPLAVVADFPQRELALRTEINNLNKEIVEELKSAGRDELKVKSMRTRLDDIKVTYRVLKDKDVIYFTSGGMLFCLDRTSGKQLSQANLSFVPSTMAMASLYYIFIGALDRNWVYQLDAGDYFEQNWFKANAMIRTRPHYEHPMLYFGTDDGKIYSYDAESNALRWTFSTEKGIVADFLMDEDTLYIGSTDYALYAVDRYTGVLLWKIETGSPIVTRPTMDKRTVYQGDVQKTERILYFRSEEDALYAVDLLTVREKDDRGNDVTRATYKLRWKFPQGRQFLLRGKDHCYVIGLDNKTLYALNPDDGKVKKTYSLAMFPSRLSNLEAGALYLATADGYIYAVAEK